MIYISADTNVGLNTCKHGPSSPLNTSGNFPNRPIMPPLKNHENFKPAKTKH